MNTQPFEQSFKLLKNSYRFAIAAFMSVAFFIVATASVSASPQVTFNGTGVGAIPDGAGVFNPTTLLGCQVPGQPLNVSFNVTGLTGSVQTVAVTITFNPPHQWGGDVVATLIAPGGQQLDLFGYTGSTTNGSAGRGSELAGPYTFSDAATQSWWAAANAAGDTGTLASGSYRTSQRGGTGSTGANTSLNAVFGGLTAAQANGQWTLRFVDGCGGDTGGVSAAVLDITTQTTNPPVAAKPFFDYFGSGKSSFATYNSTGTNIIWRILNNGGAGQETVFWGLSTADDPRQNGLGALTPGYFDADNRADIGVWRPSANAGESRFFIRNTNPVALNAISFGTSNDFAGYDADYDGDGRDDPTTIRRVNNQWQWNYRASSTNALRTVSFGATTGNNATDDIPLAGADFSGDGRADIVIIRQNGSGAETWIWGDSVTGQLLGSFIWGEFDTDYFILGDFIGDSRFDFAVWRGFGAGTSGIWYIRENGGTGFAARQFGNPRVAGTGGAPATGDIPVAGDFGGDSKYDIAVYRQSNNTFYWLNSLNATTASGQQFGQAGDRPVGELRTY